VSTLTLQEPRDVVSPRVGKQWGTNPPTRPGDANFEEVLCEVVDTVEATEKGKWSTELIAKNNPTELGGEVPKLIAKKLMLGTDRNPIPRNLALAVAMDKYWHLGEFLLDELLASGEKFKIDKPGTIQFCDKDSGYMQVMTELHKQVPAAMDRVFDIKYFWKQPRPEDYLGVPGVIFTVNGYPAPGHWSYGAGHGAAAGATAMVINRNMDLSADREQQVIHDCWCFAQGRTLLGVHFHEDNELGFRVGMQF